MALGLSHPISDDLANVDVTLNRTLRGWVGKQRGVILQIVNTLFYFKVKLAEN